MTNSPRPDPLADDLTQMFDDFLARNTPHFGGGGPGYYGVHLENVAPGGSELDLVLTFRTGRRYCCLELGCHLGVGGSRFWSGLRQEMDAHGLGDRPLPTIRLVRMVVEAGALVDLAGVPRRRERIEYEEGPFCPDQEEPDR